MAREEEVIGFRTHVSISTYTSWLRKIGLHTYRFRFMGRTDGTWKINVDRSIGGRSRHWQSVHEWSSS